jgi:hypothetical protein
MSKSYTDIISLQSQISDVLDINMISSIFAKFYCNKLKEKQNYSIMEL